MSDTFDINDRRTWAWILRDAPKEYGPDIPSVYRVDPESREHFYIAVPGGFWEHRECAPGTVYDPTLLPGPVCVSATDCDEAAIYDRAVSQGLVVDQR